MAPERPRSASYDIHIEPRIIERKPENEVRELPITITKRRSKKLTFGFKLRNLFRPARVQPIQPRSILRRPRPEPEEPEYVEVREPGRRRPSPPISPRRAAHDTFVPLPPRVPSPGRYTEEEPPVIQIRSPRRRTPIIHAPSPPLRQHRRRPSPSPPATPIREVETVRVRRLERIDHPRAERQRERDAEVELRIERERRRDAEITARRLEEDNRREHSERRRAERAALDAQDQRRSAEIVAEELQLEMERRERLRRLEEREAAVVAHQRGQEERERRERDMARVAFAPRPEVIRPARAAARPETDNGAAVLTRAREAGRRRQRAEERIFYIVDGRRVERDRRD
jgi:hypothetical protein